MLKNLLVVYHSQTGRTAALAAAVAGGASSESRVRAVVKRASEATIEDLICCSGLVIGSPENFGTMSGMVKDFFDRTYYPAEGRTVGLPYAIIVSAGNDGRGAVRDIERIARGYGWRQIAEPLIVRGDIDESDLVTSAELGESIATGISMGIY